MNKIACLLQIFANYYQQNCAYYEYYGEPQPLNRHIIHFLGTVQSINYGSVGMRSECSGACSAQLSSVFRNTLYHHPNTKVGFDI